MGELPPTTIPGHRGPVPRADVIRVLRAFAEVTELSNRWIEIKKWGVILEQIYFPDEVVQSGINRLAKKLQIPPNLFWQPELLNDYIVNAQTSANPLLPDALRPK